MKSYKQMGIKVVGFDADDTLWVNENYFREAEKKFCELLANTLSDGEIISTLYENEMNTLDIYGFGIKAFTLSLIETASQLAGNNLDKETIDAIIHIGKTMLNKPVELLSDVESTLKSLYGKYKLVLVTKGDLLDQQRKLKKSGLDKYFHHVEVMSNKHEVDYTKLIKLLDIEPAEFMMIGNSLKSDILPVKHVGAEAIYVPYEVTWQHETVDSNDLNAVKFHSASSISEILTLL